MSGILYLIPSFLGHHPLSLTHPKDVLEKIHTIEHFAVEKLQTAVQFLNKAGHPIPEFKLNFYPLDKHVTPLQLNDIVQILEKGSDVGILSDAGCPGIADPGADLVWLCHLRNIRVVPLVGPTAIVLAVMSAGLNGQNFAFNGYLPMQKDPRALRIRELQNRSARDIQAQVFIEAPNRNTELLEAFKTNLLPETRLSVAWNILADDEWIRSAEVSRWSIIKLPEQFDKKPAMFLFQSGGTEQHQPEQTSSKRKKAKRR